MSTIDDRFDWEVWSHLRGELERLEGRVEQERRVLIELECSRSSGPPLDFPQWRQQSDKVVQLEIKYAGHGLAALAYLNTMKPEVDITIETLPSGEQFYDIEIAVPPQLSGIKYREVLHVLALAAQPFGENMGTLANCKLISHYGIHMNPQKRENHPMLWGYQVTKNQSKGKTVLRLPLLSIKKYRSFQEKLAACRRYEAVTLNERYL